MASATTAQEIIDDVELVLQDESNDFWKAADLLQFLNNGIKAVCQEKPDAYILDDSVALVAGITQTIPAAGFQLEEITCNMGAGGSTPGNAIRMIERRVLDAMIPGWPTDTTSATVEYYMYDERNPTTFLVYPAQPSSSFGYIQMKYAAAPAEVAAGAVIPLRDIYRDVLTDYVLFRAYSIASDVPASANRAIAYKQSFQAALGIRQTIEEKEDPNVN